MSYGHRDHTPKAVTRVAILGAAALLASLILAPSPGSAEPDGASSSPRGNPAEPTIHAAKARIESLNHEAEIASEQLNTVEVQLADARQQWKTLASDLNRQRTQVEALREHVIGTSLSDYQSGSSLSVSTEFLVADDPQDFFTDLANSAVAQNLQASLLTELTDEQRQLAVQEVQYADQLDAIGVDKAKLAAHQVELDDKTKQAQDVLEGLEEAERQRLLQLQQEARARQLSRAAERTSISTSDLTTGLSTSDTPASERAQVAVDTALAQVGDAYVYGAVGPDAFDCSGLTMYAWAAAGVAIPHSSGMQPGAGTPVSVSALMPGDLVFYYSPISHVGMYIGNGQIVHAPNPSSSVEVVSLDLMPIAMAVRIG